MRPEERPHAPTAIVAPFGGDGSTATSGTRLDPDLERRLVDRARTDGAAFAALYDFYLPRIYGFVQRRTRDHAVSEDLTATTFERALAALRGGRFRNDSFAGWLYRVAGNLVIDHARRARRVSPASDPDELDPGGDEMVAAIDRDEVRRALAALSDAHRRVLALRFFDDLDPAEASVVLGCSRRTFAVKLHRALTALRAAMAVEPSTTTVEASDVA